MDFKQIQELIKLVNKSNIGELTIEEKGFHITIKQKEESGTTNNYGSACTNATCNCTISFFCSVGSICTCSRKTKSYGARYCK